MVELRTAISAIMALENSDLTFVLNASNMPRLCILAILSMITHQ